MKMLLVLAFSSALFALSCVRQPFLYVERNISHTKELVYNINTTGAINQTSNLYMDDLVKALTDDLDGKLYKRGYTIKELTIQSAVISLTRNQGNTALTMNISSFVVNHAASVSPSSSLMRESKVEINEVTVFTANASLMGEGLDKVNKALADAVKRLYKGAFLSIDIKGSPLPSTARVAITLKFDITFNMQYSYCEESLFLIDGPTCPY